MRDWIAYIKEQADSGLWGFILLDYYHHKKGQGYKGTPSQCIDEVVEKLPNDVADIVLFHDTLLSVCVHLLGVDFSDTMGKSISFLKRVTPSPTEQQLESIIQQYEPYGKHHVFRERISAANLNTTGKQIEASTPPLSLDERILAALSDRPSKGGAQDFAADPSAVSKAKQVLETVRREAFDVSHAVFVSIGGGDGSELEHLLRNSEAVCGLLLEYDDSLSKQAQETARALQDSTGKRMTVFTGDALQKVDLALRTLDELRQAGEAQAIILTMHAVLHEFPSRGSGTTDLEEFLQKFLWRLPIIAIAREPCMPDGLPPIVYLSADCRPDVLAKLATRIQSAHPEFRSEKAPAPMAKGVRMGSRLAMETLVKLFYLGSFSYELEERITSFTKQELVSAFCNVFGTENVRTEAFQTDSLDRFWRELRIVLSDGSRRELAKPELHVRIVAKWEPLSEGAGIGGTGTRWSPDVR